MTDIISDNIEVRQICQATGMPEYIVLELIKNQKNGNYAVPRCWSIFLGSDLLYLIPKDMIEMTNELRIVYQCEGELKALQKKGERLSGPDLMDNQLDMEGMRIRMESSRSAFYYCRLL